jgi:hypothetical protein
MTLSITLPVDEAAIDGDFYLARQLLITNQAKSVSSSSRDTEQILLGSMHLSPPLRAHLAPVFFA